MLYTSVCQMIPKCNNAGAVPQAALCQAWVRFEREHGSLEDHLQAVLKTTPILERAAAEAIAAANAEAAALAQACCRLHH